DNGTEGVEEVREAGKSLDGLESSLNGEEYGLLTSRPAKVRSPVSRSYIEGSCDPIEVLETGLDLEWAASGWSSLVDEVVQDGTGHFHIDTSDRVDELLEAAQVER